MAAPAAAPADAAPLAAAASTAAPQPVVLNTGQVIAGHEIIKPLGKGKFSIVYMAKRLADGLYCALKKINIFDMMQPKQREKCLKEVRILQSLDHPHIVRLLEAIVEQNELLIIVDWAEKGDLKRLIRKAQANETRFKEPQIWEYGRQLSGALDHMHNKRVMHRDIKPANIFMASDGTLKLGDLGLGRLMSSETLEAFSKVGTPLYMSPEVLHGAGYDMKSDVWSLGCVIYELAMLKSPFKSEQQLSLYDLFVRISKGQFPPLSESCSEEFKRLVNSMLLLKPAERPDAATVQVACEAQLAALAAPKVKVEQPVSGSPSPGDQPRVPCRPSPLLVMDDVVEKLKLLDCEEKLLRPRGYPIFHRCFFTHKAQLPGELTQFEVMYELYRWILSLIRQREEATAQAAAAAPLPLPAGGVLAADASAGPCAAMPRPPAVAPSIRRRQHSTGIAGADMGAGDAAAGGCGTSVAGIKGAGGFARAACPPARVRVEDIPDLTENLLVELRDRGLPVTSQGTIKQLQQGFGEAVCLILNELINQELLGRDFHFEAPLWTAAGNDGAGDGPEEVEEDIDGILGASRGSGHDAATDSDEPESEDHAFARRCSPSEAAGRAFEPVHFTEVDVPAWRAEVERTKDRLKVVVRPSDSFGGWRETVATTLALCRKVTALGLTEALAADLSRDAAQRREELEALQHREDQINALFSERVASLAALRAGSGETAGRLAALQESVARQSEELASVEQELEAAQGATACRSDALVGDAQLPRMRQSLQRLRAEDRQLALRTAVVQAELAARSLREAPGRSQSAADTAYRDGGRATDVDHDLVTFTS